MARRPHPADRRPARDVSPQIIVAAVPCAFCGAGRDERCWNGAHGRQITGAHWQRRKDYERAIGARPKLRGDVTVRFACPICGGPHPRADHPTHKGASPA